MSGNDDQSSVKTAASVVVPVTAAIVPSVAVPLERVMFPTVTLAIGDVLALDPNISLPVPAIVARFVDESLPYFGSDDDGCLSRCRRRHANLNVDYACGIRHGRDAEPAPDRT